MLPVAALFTLGGIVRIDHRRVPPPHRQREAEQLRDCDRSLDYRLSDAVTTTALFGGPASKYYRRQSDRVEELVDGYESPVPETVHKGLRRYFHDECTKLEA